MYFIFTKKIKKKKEERKRKNNTKKKKERKKKIGGWIEIVLVKYVRTLRCISMRVYMCICCYAGVDSDPFLFPKASPSALVAKGLAPVKGFLAGLCVGLVVKLVVPVPVRGGGAGASPRG